jgi:DNA sulfur modification protein DndC
MTPGRRVACPPHTDFKGCYIFTPIKDLTTTEVWATLINSKPPWGGTCNELTALFKDAVAGECPFVMSESDAPPACGTSSARFGCWTCTVLEKDNSLESLITAGHLHLEPLSQFRKRLKQVSDNPDFRSRVRRNGQPGMGPLTMAAREILLQELLEIQARVGLDLGARSLSSALAQRFIFIAGFAAAPATSPPGNVQPRR